MNFEKYVISFIITSLIFNSEKLLSLEILNPVGFFFLLYTKLRNVDKGLTL